MKPQDLFQELTKTLVNSLRVDEFLNLNLSGEKSQFTRFNHSKIRQTGAVDDFDLCLELLKKSGTKLRKTNRSWSLTQNLEFDLQKALFELKEARADLEQLKDDPFAEEPLEGKNSTFIRKGQVPSLENLHFEVLPRFQNLDAVGLWSSGPIYRAFSNSKNLLHWFETENFVCDYSLYTPDQKAIKRVHSGFEFNHEEFSRQLENSKTALSKLNQSGHRVKAGNYRAYLSSACVHELTNMLSWGCVGEASIQNKESPFLKLREGQNLSEKFSLAEDFSSGLSPRFTGDGELAPESLKIIEKGKLKNTLVSRRSAREYSCASTGATASEGLRSPRFEPGTLDESKAIENLGEGLYLSNLHYLNWSDQAHGRITGLSRYACFWVEAGKLKAPLETIRFDDTLFRLFGSELEALGSQNSLEAETGTYERRSLGGALVPGILCSNFQVVG